MKIKKILLKSLSVIIAVVLVAPVQLFATYKNLNEAVADTTAYKVYNLTQNETVSEDLGNLAGTQLIVNGNGENITTQNSSGGFNIASDKILKIENIGTISGFKQIYGGAIFNNKGTVTIGNGTMFSSNSANYGGAIDNYGTVTIGNGTMFSSNSANYGGAIYNYDGTVTIGNGAMFSSNSAEKKSGGAIFNGEGTVTIGNGAMFSSNSAEYAGGAIYNYAEGTVTIGNGAMFSSNNSTESSGGAIFNEEGTVTIGNGTTFSSNSAEKKSGGAIYNDGIVTIGNGAMFSSNNSTESSGGAILNNNNRTVTIGDGAMFSSNSANYGGAIDNYGTVIIGDGAIFSSNSAEYYGGAIYNDPNGIVTIGNGTMFSSNSAEKKSGGAIYNEEGTVTIGNEATFSSNSAEYTGGAIDNSGTVTIGDGAMFDSNVANYGGAIDNSGTVTIGNGAMFSSNSAESSGGAIYNFKGTLNLIANTNNIEFTGNKANGVSNAIYDEQGTINLWAGTADIIFNDRITSYDSSSVLNINSSTTTLTATGKVILNEDMRGYTGTINLYAGTLKLGEKGTMVGKNINVTEGAVINSINNELDSIVIKNYSGNGLFEIDANLCGSDTSSNDKIFLTNDSTGTITLSNVNILSITEDDWGYFTLLPDGDVANLNVDLKVNTGGEVVKFEKFTGYQVAYEKLSGTQTLKEMVADTTAYKVYNLTQNETVSENLGSLAGTQLIVNGNWKNITTQNSSGGFNIASDKILKIENIGTISGFKQNYGGAIYNDEGTVIIGNGTMFSSNSANDGGAIDNYGTVTIGNGATFSSNSSKNSGGAIYNDPNGTVTIGNGAMFDSNVAFYGGAIYNFETVTIGNGAMFSSNSAKYSGGAIDNYGTVTIGNGAMFSSNRAEDHGGAIYNGTNGTVTIGDGTIFSSNSAGNYGGAIYNKGTVTIGNGAMFSSNSASWGGAIDNYKGTLNLIANTNNVEFTGNKANGVSNAIYDYAGTINLWAGTADIIFNDRITSKNNLSVLNINSSTTTLTATGKVILNEDMRGYTGTVNLYAGTLKLGKKGTFFDGNLVVDNATIDFANKVVQETNFHNLTINNALNLKVDADLQAEKMDTITADSYTNGKKINVTAVNIIKDTSKKEEISLEFVKNEDMKQDVTTTVTKAYSDMWEYDISYDNVTGNMNFLQGEMVKVNPMVQESAVANIGSYVGQVAVANQAFASIDSRLNQVRSSVSSTSKEKSAVKTKTNNKTNTKSTNTKQNSKKSNKTSNLPILQSSNLYVSANTNQVFEPMGKIERGLWLRPYIVSDTLDLGAVSSVDNTMYGTLAGYDMPIESDKMLSFYIGYTGGNQKYEQIKMSQTAYVLGATGMLIRDKWYVGATINVGMNKTTADNDFGSDDIDKTTYSIGFKGGYDFDLGKNWVLQPNMILMYIGATSSDFTNAQGNKIKDSGISSILLQPQVKASWKLKDGWTPYGLLDVAINTGESEPEVNGTKLESMKLDPYFEYGIGVNKNFIGSAWSCYGEVTGKSGSRSGVGFNCGVKYAF